MCPLIGKRTWKTHLGQEYRDREEGLKVRRRFERHHRLWSLHGDRSGIIYISSDDEMECTSSASVYDLDILSDDDEVALLAQCIERPMELPAVSESIPVPTGSSKQEENRAGTLRLSYIPGPMINAGYFDLGMGTRPIARDPRLRNDHPINICSQLIPMVDTPMLPPTVDKYPTGDWRAVAESTTNNNQQCPSGIHFRGPSGNDNPYITDCTVCLICGKSVEQIQDEAVIDYLHKTAIRGNLQNNLMPEY